MNHRDSKSRSISRRGANRSMNAAITMMFSLRAMVSAAPTRIPAPVRVALTIGLLFTAPYPASAERMTISGPVRNCLRPLTPWRTDTVKRRQHYSRDKVYVLTR